LKGIPFSSSGIALQRGQRYFPREGLNKADSNGHQVHQVGA
jgi:hypothetical protein